MASYEIAPTAPPGELTLLLESLSDPGNPVLTLAVLEGLFFGIDHDTLHEHAVVAVLVVVREHDRERGRDARWAGARLATSRSCHARNGAAPAGRDSRTGKRTARRWRR